MYLNMYIYIIFSSKFFDDNVLKQKAKGDKIITGLIYISLINSEQSHLCLLASFNSCCTKNTRIDIMKYTDTLMLIVPSIQNEY